MESVVLEKHEFENRDESMSQIILAFVVQWDSNAEKKVDSFLGQYSSKIKVISSATLVEGVNPEGK